MDAQIDINTEDLRNFLKSLTIVANNGILSFSEDEISSKLVDPANVLMGTFNLPAKDMIKYSITEPGNVALRFDILEMYTAGARKNETIHLIFEGNLITIQYTGIEYTMRTLDSSIVKSIPKIPVLEFNTTIELSTKDLTKSIKACININNFVKFQTIKDKFELSAERNSDGVIAAIEDSIITSETNSHAMYSSDYLKDIVKGITHSTDTVIKFATDFPLRIETALCETGNMAYIIAPRIESD